jgi:hypothetical protein
MQLVVKLRDVSTGNIQYIMNRAKQSRRDFLKASAAGISTLVFLKNAQGNATDFNEPHTELNELTIVDLQAKMKSGEFSARRLSEMYLEKSERSTRFCIQSSRRTPMP